MTDYTELRVETDGPVQHITLTTAGRYNSLTETAITELLDAAATAAEDHAVRCITLTGSDGVFSSGANLAAFAGDQSDGQLLRRLASHLHDAIIQLHQAEKPLVTAVNGVAAGAGFSLAILGDIVLISDDARLEYAYPRIGLTGDGGSTFYLPRLVGLRKAREIVLLDEPIAPDTAVDLGLATEVVPAATLEDRTGDLAAQLAAKPTESIGSTKRLLTESFDRSLEAQLAAETEAIALASDTEDYQRGYGAFGSEHEPEFVGR